MPGPYSVSYTHLGHQLAAHRRQPGEMCIRDRVLVKQPARVRQGVVDLPQDVELQGVVLGEGRRDERLLTQEGLGGYPVERKAGG